MDASTNLNLPFIVAAQAQKHVTHNEALRTLDAVVQLMVLDRDLASPPGSPSEGDRYVVATSPTGAWAGQAGNIAAWQDGAWAFYTAREGWLAWVADEDKLYVWNGAAWAEFAGGGGGGGIANVVEDTSPELGGDLESNGHDVILENGDAIKGGATAGHVARLQVRDVDGASWVDVLAWTANDTPSADLAAFVTHGGAAIYKAGGSDVGVADGGTGASDAAGARVNLGLAIGADVQAFSSVLATLAGASANGQSLITAADYAAMRALLDLEAGTDFLSPSAIAAAFQPLDELLSEIAALAAAPGADSGLFFDDSAGAIAYWTPAAGLEFAGTNLRATANQRTATLTFVIDGGGSAITTGIKGDLEIPFACTIQQVTLLADQSGSIVVDIWKDTYANFPPTDADSITASAPPTISAAVKAQDATLTGWTTSVAAGDILRFNVDSAATITRLTLSLAVTKS